MRNDWVKIYTSNDFYKSEIVRQILVDHGVEGVLLDKQGFPYKIGEVEIYVHRDHFNEALEIIIKNEL
ncbi:putative signal transducing protein [Desertivirga brevis]|uniref:putative signal transducing protein n=1 Tax=Desertivirga brevis TaxID=2810310 RepID=UPI001A96B4C6|nr:DUF2007 domain-containing protein [Pedobacter sp. SYSU D00873]